MVITPWRRLRQADTAWRYSPNLVEVSSPKFGCTILHRTAPTGARMAPAGLHAACRGPLPGNPLEAPGGARVRWRLACPSMGNADSTPETERCTVSEAADMLGITTGAVRNRLSRGTLPKVKEGGTVYVLLPAGMSRDAERDADDMPPGMSHPEPDTLTSELRDRLRYVEGQLEAERQTHAEARRLLAAALERIPAIEAPHEATEVPQDADEQRGRGQPRSAAGGAQEGATRPWWRRVRRVFGG